MIFNRFCNYIDCDDVYYNLKFVNIISWENEEEKIGDNFDRAEWNLKWIFIWEFI